MVDWSTRLLKCFVDRWFTNPTSIHEGGSSLPGLAQRAENLALP